MLKQDIISYLKESFLKGEIRDMYRFLEEGDEENNIYTRQMISAICKKYNCCEQVLLEALYHELIDRYEELLSSINSLSNF